MFTTGREKQVVHFVGTTCGKYFAELSMVPVIEIDRLYSFPWNSGNYMKHVRETVPGPVCPTVRIVAHVLAVVDYKNTPAPPAGIPFVNLLKITITRFINVMNDGQLTFTFFKK